MRFRGPVLVLVVLAPLFAGCGGGEEAAPQAPGAETAPAPAGVPADAALPEVECTEQEFADQGAVHVAELPPGFEYNSFPPTSGPHAPQPIIWNAYTEPLPQLNLVHNLEHGGIVIQFGRGVPEDVIRLIIEWYLLSPEGIIVAPLPDLGDTIALTAWQHLLTCTGFDEDAYTDFRDEFRFKGPEKVPLELMQPGT